MNKATAISLLKIPPQEKILSFVATPIKTSLSKSIEKQSEKLRRSKKPGRNIAINPSGQEKSKDNPANPRDRTVPMIPPLNKYADLDVMF